MRNASIAQTGTPRQLYEEPADSFVADFIGEANLVDVNIESIDADNGMAILHLEGIELRLPSRGLPLGAARLAVRPNRIELLEGQVADGLVAEVVKSTYVGNHMEYVIRLAHGEWFATSDDVDRTHPVGSTVMIRFRSCGPVLLAA